jgi:hypothetical protein
MKRLLFLPTAFLAAGCLGSGDFSVRNTLDFDFNVHGLEWFGGVADVPAAQVADVGLIADLRSLPSPLNTTLVGLYLSGTTVGGDLFMFQKKHWSGLTAGATYTISLQVEFASNYHAGCTTGPGPVAFIKMGATATEPLAIADQQGILRMNIDKGAGINPGGFVQLGDIRNTITGCTAPSTFGPRTTTIITQPTPLITDTEGGFWTFIGVQSTFAGTAELHLLGMRLVVEGTN